MAQTGKTVVAKTVSTRDFTAALAQNAAIFLSLDVKDLGVGLNVDSLVRSLQILSVENLSWELWLFRSALQNPTDPDTNGALGYWAFGTTAVRIGGAGLYNYYIDGLGIPYRDLDRTSKIHMALINRSVASKTADAAGAVRLQLVLEPTLGW